MKKIIIFCEGKNDRFFIHEIIIKTLNFKPSQVKHYENQKSFILDARSDSLKRVSILEGGGYPNLIKLSVKLIRNFWYKSELKSVGIIGDSDRGDLYQKLVDYLTQYLNTPCKTHNISPHILENNTNYQI
ncbi:MAG: hypothetical protein ACTSYB_06075 [Candidatus Helarchaeota archaeon]